MDGAKQRKSVSLLRNRLSLTVHTINTNRIVMCCMAYIR
jgi:hypothetical protein